MYDMIYMHIYMIRQEQRRRAEAKKDLHYKSITVHVAVHLLNLTNLCDVAQSSILSLNLNRLFSDPIVFLRYFIY